MAGAIEATVRTGTGRGGNAVTRRSGRMLAVAAAAGGGWLVASVPSAAQSADTASPQSSAPAIERRRLISDLARVSDFVPHFDDAAFYGLLDLAAAPMNRPDAMAAAAATPVTWEDLTERPAQFRGRLVRIRGIVESSRRFELTQPAIVGESEPRGLLQTEISTPGAAKIFTIISTQSGPPIAVRSNAEVSGWFLKVRRFRTTGGGDSYGPVIITSGISPLASPGERQPDDALRRALFVGMGMLAIGWLLIRRLTRRAARSAASPAALRTTAAERADFAWLMEPADPRGGAKGDDPP